MHFKRTVLHPVFVSADNQTRIKSWCRSLEPFRSHYYWFSVLTLFTGRYFSPTMYNNAQLWRAPTLIPFYKSQHNCRHFSGFCVQNILHWMNVLTWLQLTWLRVHSAVRSVTLLWHSVESFKTAPTGARMYTWHLLVDQKSAPTCISCSMRSLSWPSSSW